MAAVSISLQDLPQIIPVFHHAGDQKFLRRNLLLFTDAEFAHGTHFNAIDFLCHGSYQKGIGFHGITKIRRLPYDPPECPGTLFCLLYIKDIGRCTKAQDGFI